MTDVAISWNADFCEGDLSIEAFDLTLESGLRSAVLISVFTDARASSDELPDGETDRRGWWGDRVENDDDETGSLLWVLEREKETAEVAAKAETYIQRCLAWMVTDGLATAVSVIAEWTAHGRLEILTQIPLPDGSVLEMQFEAPSGAG